MAKRFILWILLLLGWPACAWATQAHGGPEGLQVHQFAHLFFIFSMGLLIYWLRKRHLVASQGWRFIQYAALFFIIWNLDAFISHWLEEQSALIQIQRIGVLQARITVARGMDWLVAVYYITKLDHLFCVPAMACLYWGLRLLKNAPPAFQGIKETDP